MSEEPDSEEATFDSAAFEEWVEKTAESKGISRGEVLDQMLSSYWILEELTGMMDEAGQGGPASRFGADTSEGEPESGSQDADTTGDGSDAREEAAGLPEQGNLSELVREFQELRSAIMEMPDRRETGRRREAPNPRWDEPRRSRSPPRRPDERLQRTLSDLEDRVEDNSEELSATKDTHDEDVAALEADIDETRQTLQTLESSVDNLVGHAELESLAVSLEQELSRIEESTTEQEGRLTQVEEAHAETAGKLADIAEGQSALEERLEREFDSIEDVFQHLLDKTDDLEYRLGAVSDSQHDEFESLEDHIEDREQLATLMREAHRKDISTAVCDSCETKVDLRLLEEPYCPECDRSITGLDPGGWLPFDKSTLETEPIQTASEGLDDGSQDPSELLESPPSGGPR